MQMQARSECGKICQDYAWKYLFVGAKTVHHIPYQQLPVGHHCFFTTKSEGIHTLRYGSLGDERIMASVLEYHLYHWGGAIAAIVNEES